jgi:hypothetical protein
MPPGQPKVVRSAHARRGQNQESPCSRRASGAAAWPARAGTVPGTCRAPCPLRCASGPAPEEGRAAGGEGVAAARGPEAAASDFQTAIGPKIAAGCSTPTGIGPEIAAGSDFQTAIGPKIAAGCSTPTGIGPKIAAGCSTLTGIGPKIGSGLGRPVRLTPRPLWSVGGSAGTALRVTMEHEQPSKNRCWFDRRRPCHPCSLHVLADRPGACAVALLPERVGDHDARRR